MKKIFFVMVFALMSSFCFATNAVEAKKVNYQITDVNDADGWYCRCYVTVTNLETGEVRRVYSFGFGSSKSEALTNCGSNAHALADAMYAGH